MNSFRAVLPRIARAFASRRIWVTMGLVAVVVALWLVGPLIAVGDYRPLETVSARIWATVSIVAIWGARRAWLHWRAAHLNAELLTRLHEQAPATSRGGEAEAAHVRELRNRFDEAAALLKSARLGDVEARSSMARWFDSMTRRYLYQLPWYVFIGAPGSGKTTALVNSGLTFPLAEQFGRAAIRGVGGTRHCDWWFTNEAVLIDTAGRYTTHESNRALDEAEWAGFVGLLKKYRGRQPLNGALLTISVSDLLDASEMQRTQHAMALRKRLQELRAQLGIQFPVYVLVTKADLLAGFSEYFSAFGRAERTQVWGFTIALDESPNAPLDVRAVFEREYAILHQRLNEALPELLSAEADPSRRHLIYSLPQQFAGLKDVLGQFVAQVFSHSKFDSMPLLRGIYLTSGTQEGTVFDRVMGGIKRFLRIDPAPPAAQAVASGRSFFLKMLLQDLIFKEASLAGTDLRWRLRRRLLTLAGYAAVVLLSCVLLIAWLGSYWRNRAYVDEVAARVPMIERQLREAPISDPNDTRHVLAVLNMLRNLALTDEVDPDHPAARYRWGLFQGRKLESAADDVYHRALDELLLPLAVRRMQAALRDAPANDPAYAYAALKAYLMLYESDHYDPVFMQAVLELEEASAGSAPMTPRERDALRRHLSALFDGRVVVSPLPRDDALVAHARDGLLRMTFAQRLYAQLARTLRPAATAYDVDVARMAGPSAALAFRRQSGARLNDSVPGLYTYGGYWNVFDKRLTDAVDRFGREEIWVLGLPSSEIATPGARDTHASEVRSLYFDDFIKTWDDYLGDLRLQPSDSVARTAQMARLLSAPDSPLVRMANAVAAETSLSRSDNPQAGLAARAEDKVDAARRSLSQIFQPQPTAGDQARANRAEPESVVDAHFTDIRSLRGGAAGAAQSAAMSDTLKSIDALYVYLVGADSALRSGSSPPPSDASAQLKAQAGRMPAPFRQILTDLGDSADANLVKVVDANVARSAASDVGDFCRQAIAGRYPLVRSSSRDATADDFAHLFAAGGLMDAFFQKNLQSRVDTSSHPWRLKGAATAPFVASFENAAVIRDAFFSGGERVPTIKLNIMPLDLDPSISEWSLDVDGQVVRYAHGPQAPMTVQWPGPNGTNQVRLQIVDQSGASDGFAASGPWALLRLFDHASLMRTSTAETTRARFSVGGKSFAVEVTASSVHNPLDLPQLESFTCPTQR
ncbi:type VI secretion system membrane subunit TssM [Trinickia sp. Y13]|uniref:type VI secretion system membrane subunit TssM n=1 Tax=Trinickia sp. Y13 TaxID=2917807 RepID=UPI002404A4F0|nr:type VI secretion system membrane subunit TssM [Trinickia sp. Y13]MDG0023202.1 type VI secretion system membrane subunit TssM [Trinickia sp. Y13]